MKPKQAWGALSIVFVLADTAFAIAFADLGYDPVPVSFFAFAAVVVYLYVLYKRYNVEVVPESDIKLFDDLDDLRILSRIYGLDENGDEEVLRQRLVDFVSANRGRPFTWVAPRAVLAFGSAFELSPMPTTRRLANDQLKSGKPTVRGISAQKEGLLGGRPRSAPRLSGIKTCPVCEANAPGLGTVCTECGADLEFYTVLSESKVGKRLIANKSSAVRRKLRYSVPFLGENR